MALKIRLARGGTKKRPHYNIVVADSRSPRDGRFIEKIGFYNPLLPKDHADRVKLDTAKAGAWLKKGATASDRVHRFLANAGLVKPLAKNNPQKAKPKKKAQERAAANAKAAEAAAAAPAEAKPPWRGPATSFSAAVIGAQGLKGEVRVKTFTEHPEALAQYRGLHTSDGRQFTVTGARATKPDEAVLTLAEVTDRTHAESLKGTELYVARQALPATGEDEFYHADLIGLRAEDVEDRVLGVVKAIHNYGASDVIEIEQPGGDSLLLAFTKETVPHIEIDKGRIVIAVPRDDEAEREHGVE